METGQLLVKQERDSVLLNPIRIHREHNHSNRLSPFERFMLWGDSVRYPMTFFFRLRFRGALDVVRLRAAWQQVTTRHFRLSSLVSYDHKRWPQWDLESRIAPPWLDHKWGCPLKLSDPPGIDLLRESGVRAWHCTEAGQTELWFQFHHSCCDAIAGVHVLEEVFAVYDNADARSYLASIAVSSERAGRVGAAPAQRLRRAAKFVWNRPQPLATSQTMDHAKLEFPAFRTHTFPADLDVKRSHSKDQRRHFTINDWLLASLFSATGAWLQSRKAAGRRACLRVAVPVSLRQKNGYQPCANCVSMVFIDRPLAEVGAPDLLLPGIEHEMSQIKRADLARTLLYTLPALTARPAILRGALRLRECLTTSVLSNLGMVGFHGSSRCIGPLRVGEATLESIQFFPPVRHGVTTAFGVLTYANRLSITMHYDPRHLSEPDADDLFTNVVRRIDNESASERTFRCG